MHGLPPLLASGVSAAPQPLDQSLPPPSLAPKESQHFGGRGIKESWDLPDKRQEPDFLSKSVRQEVSGTWRT